MTEDRVPTPTEPRTEAGRTLLDMDECWDKDGDDGLRGRILAIEAEAAEPAPPLDVHWAHDPTQQDAQWAYLVGRVAEERDNALAEIEKLRAAQPAPLLDVPEWAIARAAYVMHIAGEGEDCDPDVDAGWCPSCWIDATNWLDRSVESPADAEYERLAGDD